MEGARLRERTILFKCLERWWNSCHPPKRTKKPIEMLLFDSDRKNHLYVGLFLWGRKERAWVECSIKNRRVVFSNFGDSPILGWRGGKLV